MVTTRCVNILIYDEAILENNETFEIVLSGVNSSMVIVTTDSATIEISDDDCKCCMTILHLKFSLSKCYLLLSLNNTDITANVTVSSDVIAEGGPPLEVCVQLPTIEKNVTLHVTTYDNSAESMFETSTITSTFISCIHC